MSGIRTVSETGDSMELNVAAGEDWDAFVEYCVQRGYGGIECLSGIPGLVGGTPIQNVGAYGQEVASTIASVKVYDRQTDQIIELSNAECGFSYRTSIFNTTARDRYIVLSVLFVLSKTGSPAITYRDLKEHFGGREPSIAEVRAAVLSIRRSKSMVIDAGDPNSRSAGSFFKNPIVERAVYERIRAQFADAPYFDVDASNVKVPAAWLIERAGFAKGTVLGNAGISANHTLAIINRGNASAADIINLKNAVESAVQDRFGIVLLPEPILVGFSDASAKN
jgi:UDP-N-acetylmuramate dehydrogenase